MLYYLTSYDFKKDLEKRVHRHLEPSAWLEVKPRAPLPWSKFQLRRSYSKLLDLEKQAYGGHFVHPSLSSEGETLVSTYRRV